MTPSPWQFSQAPAELKLNSDALTLLFRWLSGAATSLVLAFVSALIGLAMWRVAYRRVRLT